MGKRSHIWSIAALAFLPALARADFSGHTTISQGALWTGTNNWAVLYNGNPSDADLIDILEAATFTPGALSDGTFSIGPTEYVYLFQATNDGPDTLSQFTNSLGAFGNDSPVSPRLWGQFETLVMRDSQGDISSSNDLDSNDLQGFSVVSGLTVADIDLTSNSFRAAWGRSGAPELPVDGTSSLMVFVSPYGPGMFVGSLQDGGGAFQGPSPAPVPSPTAAVLGLIGLACLGRRPRTA